MVHGCIFSLCETFDVLLLLTASDKVNNVFGVSHAVHKLLTETGNVEWLKTTAVVHLGREMMEVAEL